MMRLRSVRSIWDLWCMGFGRRTSMGRIRSIVVEVRGLGMLRVIGTFIPMRTC